MGLTRLALSLAVKLPKVESFDNFLFIGPHPDDIEIGAGATVSKLVRMGKKVTFLICLDGRYGIDNLKEPMSSDELATLRKQEAINAANLLGVNNVIFLNLCDGNQYEYKELTHQIARIISEVNPQVIFGPDPDTHAECHADHLNVGNAIKELANFSLNKEVFSLYVGKKVEASNVKAICLYMTCKANKIVKVKKKDFKLQKQAILCHQSQYPSDIGATSSLMLYLSLRSFEYGFKKLRAHGEGFRMLDITRMHCIPEGYK